MPEPGSPLSSPNVVPPDAAARIRSFVFERRDQPVIAPLDVVARLLEGGDGAQFDEQVRGTRVLTWVKQVFRRLRKAGWLTSRTDAEWTPTAAARACREVQALSGRVPSERRPAPGVRAAEPPSGAERPSAPPPVESWPAFVESWVLAHRDAPFGIGDLIADMLRRGFGRGAPAARLDEARQVAEAELRVLQERLHLRREDDLWRPGETRGGPSAEALPPRTGVEKRNPGGPAPERRSALPPRLEAVLAAIREKYEAARKEADLYGQMLREVEAAAAMQAEAKKPRKPKPPRPGSSGTGRPSE